MEGSQQPSGGGGLARPSLLHLVRGMHRQPVVRCGGNYRWAPPTRTALRDLPNLTASTVAGNSDRIPAFTNDDLYAERMQPQSSGTIRLDCIKWSTIRWHTSSHGKNKHKSIHASICHSMQRCVVGSAPSCSRGRCPTCASRTLPSSEGRCRGTSEPRHGRGGAALVGSNDRIPPLRRPKRLPSTLRQLLYSGRFAGNSERGELCGVL